MARAGIMRAFLDRVSVPVVKKQDTWSVIRIEKMLEELGIADYEFIYEPRVVRLADRDDLMLILKHSAPSMVSSEYDLIARHNDDLKVRLGSWQFEARA